MTEQQVPQPEPEPEPAETVEEHEEAHEAEIATSDVAEADVEAEQPTVDSTNL